MSRKQVKLILLIAGILIFAAGIAIFITSIAGTASKSPEGSKNIVSIVFTFNAIVVVGIIPLSIAALMHSKDIRETKRSQSGFFKGLAYYWIFFGAFAAVAMIIIIIFVLK